MSYQHRRLKQRIDEVCRRWKKLILLKGGSQVLLATITVFVLAFALDSFVQLDTALRLLLLLVMAVVFSVTAYLEVIRPLLRVPGEAQLARYLEEKHPHLEDRLVTAIELGAAGDPNTSHRILEKLLDDTRFHVEPLNLTKSMKVRTAVVWSGAALAACVLLTGFVFSNRDFFALKSNRILTPWKFPTIKPKPALQVTPGDLRVLRGSALEIKAELTAFEAEEITLYYSDSDSSWHKVEMDPTFDANMYVYNFFDLQLDTKYYVKADERLSDIYTFSVYDAPKIKRVDLAFKYPRYTGLKNKTERDSGDLWAPEGTVVTVTAVADKALRDATILLGQGQELRTTIREDSILTAAFTIRHDDYYRISITDIDNLSNDPPPEYYVHALSNEPPDLSIEWPGRDIKASMLEEVRLRMRVEDDYGRPNLKLRYVVNSSDEKEIALEVKERAKSKLEIGVEGHKEFAAEHVFYLEDLNVLPGDFLNYYVAAADAGEGKGNHVHSDIFFIEVRPFEKEFTRPVSQGQMGGAGSMGGRLSQTQKEIIVATWKTEQRARQLMPKKLTDDIDVLVASQENLQEVTQSTLFQMEQRSVFTRDVGTDVKKYYSEAVEAMARALEELKDKKLKAAQTPQREALQRLLLAEAQVREVQIQRSRAQGQGNNASLEELAQLFEDEMDKLNNKYETLQESPQQQSDDELNDALEKVKELAKRQQQFNRQMQDLARQELTREERKRKIEELRRQQEQIRRETQQLMRQMQQVRRNNPNLPRAVQQSLRQAASEMNNASHNLRKDNTDLAAAKGSRAFNRLTRLEKLLHRNQKESLRRQIDDLKKQFQQMTEAQRELTSEVENLAATRKQGKEAEAGIASAQQKQETLRQELGAVQKQLRDLSRQAPATKNTLNRQLRKLTQDIEKRALVKKMTTAQKLLDEKQLNSALQAEKDILSKLEDTGEDLTRLRAALAESEEEKLDLALDQTRKLRQDLEALQRQAQKLSPPQSEQSREGQQQASSRAAENRQAGPGETRTPREVLDPQKLDWMNDELVRSLNELEFIQQSLHTDTTLTRTAGNLNQSLQTVLRTFSGGLTERFQVIEKQVLIPLRGLEAELAQKLELVRNKEKLFLAREQKIPPGYKELVEKYYEVLSTTEK
ncbi:MAG: DUF4175 family protein [bacterium]